MGTAVKDVDADEYAGSVVGNMRDTEDVIVAVEEGDGGGEGIADAERM